MIFVLVLFVTIFTTVMSLIVVGAIGAGGYFLGQQYGWGWCVAGAGLEFALAGRFWRKAGRQAALCSTGIWAVFWPISKDEPTPIYRQIDRMQVGGWLLATLFATVAAFMFLVNIALLTAGKS
ncbi:hypothetical protein [Zavarzinella formosa]|uniref:hypothetical protein n=1 Tax=Zavarzinella formosa TaxID=360055 RepID=UPI0002DE92B1|nr:hypothetical protein [Zavarzinella formosa]